MGRGNERRAKAVLSAAELAESYYIDADCDFVFAVTIHFIS